MTVIQVQGKIDNLVELVRGKSTKSYLVVELECNSVTNKKLSECTGKLVNVIIGKE